APRGARPSNQLRHIVVVALRIDDAQLILFLNQALHDSRHYRGLSATGRSTYRPSPAAWPRPELLVVSFGAQKYVAAPETRLQASQIVRLSLLDNFFDPRSVGVPGHLIGGL